MSVIRWILFHLFRPVAQESRTLPGWLDHYGYDRDWTLPIVGQIARKNRAGRIVYRW